MPKLARPFLVLLGAVFLTPAETRLAHAEGAGAANHAGPGPIVPAASHRSFVLIVERVAKAGWATARAIVGKARPKNGTTLVRALAEPRRGIRKAAAAGARQAVRTPMKAAAPVSRRKARPASTPTIPTRPARPPPGPLAGEGPATRVAARRPRVRLSGARPLARPMRRITRTTLRTPRARPPPQGRVRPAKRATHLMWPPRKVRAYTPRAGPPHPLRPAAADVRPQDHPPVAPTAPVAPREAPYAPPEGAAVTPRATRPPLATRITAATRAAHRPFALTGRRRFTHRAAPPPQQHDGARRTGPRRDVALRGRAIAGVALRGLRPARSHSISNTSLVSSVGGTT